MAADVMRPLQFAAVGALGVGSRGSAWWLRRMPRRDGDVFRLGTAMGRCPSGLGDALLPDWAGGGAHILSTL